MHRFLNTALSLAALAALAYPVIVATSVAVCLVDVHRLSPDAERLGSR